jgi:hypothetical protein
MNSGSGQLYEFKKYYLSKKGANIVLSKFGATLTVDLIKHLEKEL